MAKFRKLAFVALMGSSLLLTTSCADDKLAKGMMLGGLGVGAGMLIGRQLSPGNRMGGMLLGGALGLGTVGLIGAMAK